MVFDNKLGINVFVLSTGIIGNYDISDNDSVRFVVENAGPSNVFQIRMKLDAQNGWTDVKTISGSKSEVLKTDTYDLMQIECLTLDGSGVKLLASGFQNGD